MPTALPTTDTPQHDPRNGPADDLQGDRGTRLYELLHRAPAERQREYKYRFAQSIVFGLPVIALQWWGGALGPVDADRWVSLIQSLMCGWILYVNLGMLLEGFLVPRFRLRGDFIVASAAMFLYLYSVLSALHGIFTAHLWYRPLLFHVCVILLAGWTGWRWWRLARR